MRTVLQPVVTLPGAPCEQRSRWLCNRLWDCKSQRYRVNERLQFATTLVGAAEPGYRSQQKLALGLQDATNLVVVSQVSGTMGCIKHNLS